MHKPIASIAGAALAVLIGTTTVAAVNPFQIDHAGAAVVGTVTSTAGQVMSDMGGWARGWQMNPDVHPMMTPVVGPSAAPGMHTRGTQMTQTHTTQMTRPRATQITRPAPAPATSAHGCGWCASYGQSTGGMGMGMGGPRGGSH